MKRHHPCDPLELEDLNTPGYRLRHAVPRLLKKLDITLTTKAYSLPARAEAWLNKYGLYLERFSGNCNLLIDGQLIGYDGQARWSVRGTFSKQHEEYIQTIAKAVGRRIVPIVNHRDYIAYLSPSSGMVVGELFSKKARPEFPAHLLRKLTSPPVGGAAWTPTPPLAGPPSTPKEVEQIAQNNPGVPLVNAEVPKSAPKLETLSTPVKPATQSSPRRPGGTETTFVNGAWHISI
jgi:hypothetical protein